MSSEPSNTPKWKRIVTELTWLKDRKQADWDHLDDNTLAQYIEGALPANEMDEIRTALEDNELLRELLEVVEDSIPKVLSGQPTGLSSIWTIADGVRRLAGELRVWVDETGRVCAEGFRDLMAQPALGEVMGTESSRGAWRIPTDGADISVELVFDADGQWTLRGAPASSTAPAGGQVSLYRVDDQETLEFSCTLDQWLVAPIHLEDGHWMFQVQVKSESYQIPISIGV